MHAQNRTASDRLVQPAGASPLPPAGTLALCLLTLAGSAAQSLADHGQWRQAVGLVPAHVWHLSSFTRTAAGQVVPVWLTLFTYLFLHGGWWHVLPNMAGLWVFGALAEPAMGTRRFVLSYFALGAAGAFGVGLVLPHSLKPVAGASLAISGILGAYCGMRLLSQARARQQSVLLLALETTAVLGVATWLVIRTVPAAPDLTCAGVYHLIPFMAGWFSVRALDGLHQLRGRA